MTFSKNGVDRTTRATPTIEPNMFAVPPMITIAITWMDTSKPNRLGLAVVVSVLSRTPPKPIIAAVRVNTMSL